jgi:hypothetical protein
MSSENVSMERDAKLFIIDEKALLGKEGIYQNAIKALKAIGKDRSVIVMTSDRTKLKGEWKKAFTEKGEVPVRKEIEIKVEDGDGEGTRTAAINRKTEMVEADVLSMSARFQEIHGENQMIGYLQMQLESSQSDTWIVTPSAKVIKKFCNVTDPKYADTLKTYNGFDFRFFHVKTHTDWPDVVKEDEEHLVEMIKKQPKDGIKVPRL